MTSIENWIQAYLFSRDDIDISHFAASLTLYHTPLAGSFLATLINGSGIAAKFNLRPGEFQYNCLIRQLAVATQSDSAFWFYCNLVDNAVPLIRAVWPWNIAHNPDEALARFEQQPALQGGASYMGLIDSDGDWLLLHSHIPDEEFSISLHCSRELAQVFETRFLKIS